MPRLGPSASHVAVDQEKAAEFVQAVTLLTSVMKEPWAQQLVTNMQLDLPTTDFVSALRGSSSSSRPIATAPVAPVAPVPPSVAAPKAHSLAAAPEAVAPPPPPAPPVPEAQHVDPTPPPTEPAPAPTPPPVEPAPTPPPMEATTVVPTPPSEESAVATINTSTHKAAHMRLKRRMEADPAAFPGMSKLWNGSRQETRQAEKTRKGSHQPLM